MLRTKQTWDEESESLILQRNGNFVRFENVSEICARAESWLNLLPQTARHELREKATQKIEEFNKTEVAECLKVERQKAIDSEKTGATSEDDESDKKVDSKKVDQNKSVEKLSSDEITRQEMFRIFGLDSVRTFCASENRAKHVRTLKILYDMIRDYHQGLGFVAAFFELFLDEIDVLTLCLYLNDNIMVGYFRSAAAAYFRDCKVFQNLLTIKIPEVAKIFNGLVPPETYCSKWLVGMNVHVLTFESLFSYVELLLKHRQKFLFMFGLAVVDRNRNELVSTKDVSKILTVLRLDKTVAPNGRRRDKLLSDSKVAENNEGGYFVDLVEHALSFDIDDELLGRLREDADNEMRLAELKRKAREAEMQSDSDDEIVFSDEE